MNHLRNPWKWSFIAAVAVAAVGCSGSKSGSDGGAPDAGPNSCVLAQGFNPGFTQTSPNTPNTFGITVSGETLAENGLPFCPVQNGDPNFVDGWSVEFDHYIVVLANVRLNQNPLKDSTWYDMDGQVAIKPGPYVVDAHNLKNGGFIGKDGEEPAGGLFLWTQQDNGQPFDTSVRYAFSYDIVPATCAATNVNLDSSEQGIFDKMVANGWSKYVSGRVLYAGSGTYNQPNNPNNATAQADFATLPPSFGFEFGWNDSTSVLNCVNADLGAEDDLNNRGVQTNPSGTYLAQITIHTDHLFWDTLLHEGEPLRMDPIATFVGPNLVFPDGGTATFTQNFDLNAPYFSGTQKLSTYFDDGKMTPLPDRGPFEPNCPNAGPAFQTDMGTGYQVVLDTNGCNTVNPNDYRTFMEFSVQSQAHLNAQGLCYVVGQHPEPAGVFPGAAGTNTTAWASGGGFFTPNIPPEILVDGGP